MTTQAKPVRNLAFIHAQALAHIWIRLPKGHPEDNAANERWMSAAEALPKGQPRAVPALTLADVHSEALHGYAYQARNRAFDDWDYETARLADYAATMASRFATSTLNYAPELCS